MPGMKKDGLSCRACASNQYEKFYAQHEKRGRTSCRACKSTLYNCFMRRMILRNPKSDLFVALKYCCLV